MGGPRAKSTGDRASPSTSAVTARTRTSEALAAAERQRAEGELAGTLTTKMQVSEVMSLLAAGEQLGRNPHESGRSGVRAAVSPPLTAVVMYPSVAVVAQEPDEVEAPVPLSRPVTRSYVVPAANHGSHSRAATPSMDSSRVRVAAFVETSRFRRSSGRVRRLFAALLFAVIMAGALALLGVGWVRKGLPVPRWVPAHLVELLRNGVAP